jgi:hypothetical protein
MLDGMFHNHIKSSWQPKALAKIQGLIDEVGQELQVLGPNPKDMSLSSVVDLTLNKISTGDITSRCSGLVDSLLEDYPVFPGFDMTFEGTRNLANALAYLQKKNACLKDTVTAELYGLFAEKLNAAFTEDVDSNHLERFVKLKDHLIAFVSSVIGASSPETSEPSALALNLRIFDASQGSIAQFKDKDQLLRGLNRAVLLEAVNVYGMLQELSIMLGQMKAEDQLAMLEESEEIASNRAELEKKKKNFQDQFDKIADIDTVRRLI